MTDINTKEELLKYLRDNTNTTTDQLKCVQTILTNPELIKISSFYQAEPPEIRNQVIDLFKHKFQFNADNFRAAIGLKQNELKDLEQLLTIINNNDNTTLQNYFKKLDIIRDRQDNIRNEKEVIDSYLGLNIFKERANTIKEKINTIILKIDKIILTKKLVINNSVEKYLTYYKQLLEGYGLMVDKFSAFYVQNISLHNALVTAIEGSLSSYAGAIGGFMGNTNISPISLAIIGALVVAISVGYYFYISMLFAEKDKVFTFIEKNYNYIINIFTAWNNRLNTFTYTDQYMPLIAEISVVNNELQTTISDWTTISDDLIALYADGNAKYEVLIARFLTLETDIVTFTSEYITLTTTLKNNLKDKEDQVFELKKSLYNEINDNYQNYNIGVNFYDVFREYYNTKSVNCP